jgi:hypothetical protein
MESFELTSYQFKQPNWFKRLVKAGRVLVNVEPDPMYENDDYWYLYTMTVAYLWTPDGISIAYEGDTIVNHYGYCEPA